jgi:dienelactone hydrolase
MGAEREPVRTRHRAGRHPARLAAGILAGGLLAVAVVAPPSAARTAGHSRVVPMGTYAVGRLTVTFVDTSRPTNPNGSFPGAPSRTLLTTIYYPARGLPGDQPTDHAPFDTAHGPYPLILFSHGVTARGVFYEAVLKRWASAGYVIAAPDYPLSNANAPGGVNFGRGVADVKNQPADASFVISQVLTADRTQRLVGGTIDPTRIGASGHSLGGITTYGLGYSSCCTDHRIRAAVPMSGLAGLVEPGSRYFLGPSVPILMLHGNADPLVPYQSDVDNFARAKPPKFFITFLGGGHVQPYLGGDAPAAVALERATLDFWDRYLKGDPTALRRLRADGTVSGLTTFQDAVTGP